MAYDPKIGKIVLFGGTDGRSAGLSDTWTFDGETWVLQHPPVSPAPPQTGGMVAMDYLPAIGKMVLYRGFDYPSGVSETWTYDGTTWKLQSQVGPPFQPSREALPGRSNGSMAYDPAIRRMVLYGGSSRGDGLDDTWTFDGSTWTEQRPVANPNRQSGSMVFDAAAGKLVLFGGEGGPSGCNSAGLCNDIWTYDGVTWAQHSSTVAPSPRAFPSIAYDPHHDSIIAFGGYGGGPTYARLADTWIYEAH